MGSPFPGGGGGGGQVGGGRHLALAAMVLMEPLHFRSPSPLQRTDVAGLEALDLSLQLLGQALEEAVTSAQSVVGWSSS